MKLIEFYDVLYKVEKVAPGLIFSYISPIRKTLTTYSKSEIAHNIIMQLFGNRYSIEIQLQCDYCYEDVYTLSIKSKVFIFYFKLTIYDKYFPTITFLGARSNKDKRL